MQMISCANTKSLAWQTEQKLHTKIDAMIIIDKILLNILLNTLLYHTYFAIIFLIINNIKLSMLALDKTLLNLLLFRLRNNNS